MRAAIGNTGFGPPPSRNGAGPEPKPNQTGTGAGKTETRSANKTFRKTCFPPSLPCENYHYEGSKMLTVKISIMGTQNAGEMWRVIHQDASEILRRSNEFLSKHSGACPVMAKKRSE